MGFVIRLFQQSARIADAGALIVGGFGERYMAKMAVLPNAVLENDKLNA